MPRPRALTQREVTARRNTLKTTGTIEFYREHVCGKLRTILDRFSYFVEIRFQGLGLARE